MNKTGKKFISPFAWFSLIYPSNWHEFEDSEGTFLFYNPDKWNGNFRISAYKAEPKLSAAMKYANDSIRDELKNNSSSSLVKVGKWECAYSCETFQEEGVFYTTHIWITGIKNIVFECTFTVAKGEDKKVAEEIITTLEVRDERKKYPLEIIPIRVLEVGTVNEGFERISSGMKQQLKKDFTGVKEDLPKLQQLIDSGKYNLNKRDNCNALGTAFGVILVNEIDGMEWVTAIDNTSELPALRYKNTSLLFYPQQIIWEKAKKQLNCDIQQEFEKVIEKVVASDK